MSATREVSLAHGVNVIGMLSVGVGVGVAGRAVLRVLGDRGIPHAAVDIDPGTLATNEPIPSGTRRLHTLRDLPYDTTVVCLDPVGFESLVLRWNLRSGFDMSHTVNAIMPFWELPVFPASWIPVLESFDVIMAATGFIREVAERSLPAGTRPVIIDAPQALLPPASPVIDRRRWLGDRADSVAFLSTFDILSDIERKNPWGAIRAFQLAFPERDDVTLVMKVNHADAPEHAGRFEQLRSVAAADSRVRLMTESLSRDELWSLYASADVYISLHRAEGLGFGLMESMTVGTPVVATAWSGNLDFMDEANSILVPWRLAPVTGTSHRHYDTESWQEWADPDVEEAARALAALASSRELRRQLGAKAAADQLERLRRQKEVGPYDQLLSLAAGGLADTDAHAARTRAAMREAAATVSGTGETLAALRRAAVKGLRAVGLKRPAPDDEPRWGPPTILY